MENFIFCAVVSLKSGIFTKNLKIARFTPLFKYGNANKVCNFWPVPVLPCFSKVPELIMYNRLYV